MSAQIPEQQAAIAARDRDVLLEAGAGTGKTRVLVQRYCEAAAVDGVGIDGILAFTFTERAAAEMRHRIRSELERRADDADNGTTAAEMRRLARDSERAWISTIHGFCRRLLAWHPVALGLDPQFRVLDDPETSRLATRAFDDALEEFLADGDPERARLVAAIRLDALRSLIRNAHDELRSQGHARPTLPDPKEPDPRHAIERLASAAQSAQAEIADSRAGAANVGRIAAAATLTVEEGQAPSDLELAALEVSSTAQAFKGPACRDYKEAWKAARAAVGEHQSAHLYRHLGELLRLFGERFATRKDERSGLDFEDLQLEAVRLLEERPAIADTYRRRFRHLMVDEFQDTNELQISLVRLLRGPDTKVFAVGDEFQSIYAFRHADLGVFRRERTRIATLPDPEGEVMPLSGNLRSRPGILSAVNFMGDALLEGFKHLTVGAAPDPRDSTEPEVEFLLTAGGSEWEDEALGIKLPGDYPSPPDRIAEARFVASRLRDLHEGQDVQRRDMVVLLRAFTHVAAYEEELERAGLSPYVVGGRGYWSQQQVEDLRQLLGAIANPLDDPCLLGVLASPACAVRPDTLWLLGLAATDHHVWPTLERRFGPEPREQDDESDAERYLSAIPEDDAERLRLLCQRLGELRSNAARLGLEELIDRALRGFGYDLAILSMNRGERRFANVRKLMRLARQFEAAEGRDLRGFLDYLDERAGREDREGEAATQAEDYDGVRIMTVHAAKGLEFPVVAVADLGRNLLTGGRPPAVRVDRSVRNGDRPEEGPEIPRVGIRLARFGDKAIGLFGYDELAEGAALDEAAEACRLAYVAATRAEDHLILSGRYDPGKVAKPEPEEGLPTGTPISERLIRALELDEPENGVVELPAPKPRSGLKATFEPGKVAVRVNLPEPERFAALARRPGTEEEAPPPRSGRPPIDRPTTPEPAARHLSYSALSSYGRCGYRFYVERIVGLPGVEPHEHQNGEAPAGRARRFGFGNAVHALLEWSARHDWAEPPRELSAEFLRREGLDGGSEIDRATEMVDAWLGSDLCAELNDATIRPRPEMPFLLPLAGSIIRGNMDLLAEAQAGPVIVDYKTDSVAEVTPEELIDRYEVQRKIYALAGGLAGEGRVRTAYAFLDGGGTIVHHDFEPADLVAARKELEELIAGVRSGRFEVTGEPHRALCFDCPARAHLCSYPTERTGRRR